MCHASFSPGCHKQPNDLCLNCMLVTTPVYRAWLIPKPLWGVSWREGCVTNTHWLIVLLQKGEVSWLDGCSEVHMFHPWLPALRGCLCPKGRAAPFLTVPWAGLGKVITAPLVSWILWHTQKLQSYQTWRAWLFIWTKPLLRLAFFEMCCCTTEEKCKVLVPCFLSWNKSSQKCSIHTFCDTCLQPC